MQAKQEPLLEVNGLTMKFGNLMANDDVSFSVYPGEIVGLIGPNGAGKTTCFNCVTGFLQPTSGRVTFAGVDITRRPPCGGAAGACAHLPDRAHLPRHDSVRERPHRGVLKGPQR